MEKVALFTGMIVAVEEELNKWYADNPNVTITDRKISTHAARHSPEREVICCTIAIFYKK